MTSPSLKQHASAVDQKWQINKLSNIFQNSSKTYFYSSFFFPKDIKEKVFRLYGFVRRADDYVDSIPQKNQEFEAFFNTWLNLKTGKQSVLLATNDKEDLHIIQSFIALEKECNFDHNWVESFFKSMKMDCTKRIYNNYEELNQYIYGSASVIGLFMCQIMQIRPIYWESAKKLGDAFQLINFIRDIKEDISLGRQYLPVKELEKYGLDSLDFSYIQNNKERFNNFLRSQIDIYKEWQKKADIGINALPHKTKIAIKTASKLYEWTANQIAKYPFIVYEKKIKPNKRRILLTYFKVLLNLG